MPNIPYQAPAWRDVPLIEPTDRVLGGLEGPANAQALALLARLQWVRNLTESVAAAAGLTAEQVATALANAESANVQALAAWDLAGTVEDAAAAAAALAATANATANGAATTAGNAQTAANGAATTAGTAQADAAAAVAAVATKATRYDLGTVSLTYSAALALGAGARSIAVACPGSLVGDAVFVAATGAVPDGYAVGAAQCLAAGTIRVSVVHPALVLGPVSRSRCGCSRCADRLTGAKAAVRLHSPGVSAPGGLWAGTLWASRPTFISGSHMLKSIPITLPGRDAETPLTLTELPALVADRHARAALAAIDAPQDGGVVALAFTHVKDVLALGERGQALLEPFVVASRPVRSWRNVLALQQAALALHVGFLVNRPRIELPVLMQAEAIGRGAGELAVHFCSPALATVLHSGRATYRELETVLSTEDAYNLAELVNVEAIREWRAYQSRNPQT